MKKQTIYIISCFLLVGALAFACKKVQIESENVIHDYSNNHEGTLRSSGIDTIQIDLDSFPLLSEIVTDSAFVALMDANQLELGIAYEVIKNDDFLYYSIRLAQTGTNYQDASLTIYPDSVDFYHTFLCELFVADLNGQRLKVTNLNDNIVLVNDYVNEGEPESGKVNCRNTTVGLGNCMDCAIDQLMDHWVSIIACGLHPLGCAGVALVHCLGPRNSSEPNGN